MTLWLTENLPVLKQILLARTATVTAPYYGNPQCHAAKRHFDMTLIEFH